MTRLLCAALVGLFLTASISLAQDEAGTEKGKKVKVQKVFRLSVITGMSVKSPEGADLGTIEDLVFDLKSGKVRYAALSFGGFASLGDKLFAVPWDHLTFKFGEEESYFITKAKEADLKKAPGFDQDKWPDTADPAWSKSIDAYYAQGNSDRPAPKRTKDAVKPGELTYDAVYRGATLTGMDVRNDDGKDLGSINDVVVDIEQAKIRYAALSFGGVLGLGDKLFAIPWKNLSFVHEGDDKHLVLKNVTPEKLKQAKGFDEDHWPAEGDIDAIEAFYDDDSPRKAAVPKRTE